MTDHRSDERIAWDTENNVPQFLIDAYNEGWEFHDLHWPDEGPTTPIRDAIQFARFKIVDTSPEADAYWNGYEDATHDQIRRGYGADTQPGRSHEDDAKWMKEQLIEILREFL